MLLKTRSSSNETFPYVKHTSNRNSAGNPSGTAQLTTGAVCGWCDGPCPFSTTVSVHCTLTVMQYTYRTAVPLQEGGNTFGSIVLTISDVQTPGKLERPRLQLQDDFSDSYSQLLRDLALYEQSMIELPARTTCVHWVSSRSQIRETFLLSTLQNAISKNIRNISPKVSSKSRKRQSKAVTRRTQNLRYHVKLLLKNAEHS